MVGTGNSSWVKPVFDTMSHPAFQLLNMVCHAFCDSLFSYSVPASTTLMVPTWFVGMVPPAVPVERIRDGLTWLIKIPMSCSRYCWPGKSRWVFDLNSRTRLAADEGRDDSSPSNVH